MAAKHKDYHPDYVEPDLVSTADGKLRQLTDFGQQRTFIVRRVSWSSDDKYMFAAVATGQEDIVLLDGLLPQPK